MRIALFGRYMRNVIAHKRLVAAFMNGVIADLIWRSATHDDSKFDPAEFDAYADNLPNFDKATYGTEEYRAALARIKPAIAHHYQANRHHPEHFSDGINGMNLLDVLEMVCDWMAAAQCNPGGTLNLEQQRERFGIDPQLFAIIQHTVEYLERQEER
ncbi:MAG: hypothetical protein H0X24_14160 [Ktedonobacterales bacterium]|nr:hypothetical protein [Ktedonobacterales bacterium]